MAMTNAEKQRRYRERLKARASGDALGDQTRIAVERAIAALWAFHERPAPGGNSWSAIDGCTTLDQYRSDLERHPGNLVQACRAFVPGFEGLTPAEARAIGMIVEIADALRLAPARKFAPELQKAPGDDTTGVGQASETISLPERAAA